MTVCPKCQHENPDSLRFCARCHMTLQFVCPACHYVQAHGGRCDVCGVDLVKYAMMLEFQIESATRQQHERRKTRQDLLKQALLLPLTGGWSLLKYVKSALRGE